MKQRYWLTGALVLLASWAAAHEFWLEPTRFFATVGEVIRIRTLVGDRFMGEQSIGLKTRLVQYNHHTTAGVTNLIPTITASHYGEVTVPLKQAGTHLLAFANGPKFIKMEPKAFLGYLNAEGLDNVIAAREEQGDTARNGYELYSRCAKTLMQVGPKSDEALSLTTTLPLDIVPLENPYTLTAGQRLKFLIRFNGKPQPDALVSHWSKSEAGLYTLDRARSDRRGLVQFRLQLGHNMVSTVIMRPVIAQPNVPEAADWRSYWGSITFGCRN